MVAVGELGQCGPGTPATVRVPLQEAVRLEADGEAVRGGAGEPGPLAQLAQAARGDGRGPQHPHRLVEHADSASLSHGTTH